MAASLGDDEYRELLLLRTGLRRFVRQSEQFARSAGLTPAQHQLLLAVRGHDDPAGPTIADVASYLLLRHHSVVELVDRCALAGLVERVADPHDARAVRLVLTREGTAALGRLSERNLEELGRLADRFRPLWHGLEEEGAPMPREVRVARIYDPPSPREGVRVLVDRLWPRGIARDSGSYDRWVPTVAPSTELRRWYGHEPTRFAEFARRYRTELDVSGDLEDLVELARTAAVWLLTATSDFERSSAAVLAEVLDERRAPRPAHGARATRRARR